MAKGSGATSGRSGYRAVAKDLNAGRSVTYKGNNGKTYTARVEQNSLGQRFIVTRNAGSNRRLASRRLDNNYSINEFALNVAAG